MHTVFYIEKNLSFPVFIVGFTVGFIVGLIVDFIGKPRK